MESLNEKLAEACGYEYVVNGHGCFVTPATAVWRLWNPTADMNQLRECYLAAEKDWDELATVTFEYAFTEELTILIRSTKVKYGAAVTGIELATAWVKHPELVAQAILKAKDVEV